MATSVCSTCFSNLRNFELVVRFFKFDRTVWAFSGTVKVMVEKATEGKVEYVITDVCTVRTYVIVRK